MCHEMDKLKQFDKSFGLSFTKEEVQTIFVNNIEATIYTKLKKDEAGISYYSFIEKFSFRIGLKVSDFMNPGSYELFALSKQSKSDFIQTMRFLIVIYEIMKESRFATYIDETIKDIMTNLPAPLGVRWFDGNFYKDDFPEITQELFSDNLGWLSEFPAAKTDMEIALKNYSSGDKNGIIENIYKALENVVQQIVNSSKPLHEPELAKKLFSVLNVSENWRQLLAKFVAYANDYARHGKNEGRHATDLDEIESFLFLALIILRMISKKEKHLRILPIDKQSLFHYLTNSAVVKRIENEIISINPRLRILKHPTEHNPVTKYLLENIVKLGLKSIGDIETLYLKHEKKFILEEQIELRDADVDYYVQG